MLTAEEMLPNNKQDIIESTEDILQARGIECDNRIKELSKKQLKEILEDVRNLREKKKAERKQQQEQQQQQDQQQEEKEEQEEEEEQKVTA
jgi:ribosomal protein L12E/L44/L45/RPP1/RPP2